MLHLQENVQLQKCFNCITRKFSSGEFFVGNVKMACNESVVLINSPQNLGEECFYESMFEILLLLFNIQIKYNNKGYFCLN